MSLSFDLDDLKLSQCFSTSENLSNFNNIFGNSSCTSFDFDSLQLQSILGTSSRKSFSKLCRTKPFLGWKNLTLPPSASENSLQNLQVITTLIQNSDQTKKDCRDVVPTISKRNRSRFKNKYEDFDENILVDMNISLTNGTNYSNEIFITREQIMMPVIETRNKIIECDWLGQIASSTQYNSENQKGSGYPQRKRTGNSDSSKRKHKSTKCIPKQSLNCMCTEDYSAVLNETAEFARRTLAELDRLEAQCPTDRVSTMYKELQATINYLKEKIKIQEGIKGPCQILNESLKRNRSKRGDTPDKRDKTPERRDHTPERGDKTPERRDRTPERRDQTPERRDKTPDRKDEGKEEPCICNDKGECEPDDDKSLDFSDTSEIKPSCGCAAMGACVQDDVTEDSIKKKEYSQVERSPTMPTTDVLHMKAEGMKRGKYDDLNDDLFLIGVEKDLFKQNFDTTDKVEKKEYSKLESTQINRNTDMDDDMYSTDVEEDFLEQKYDQPLQAANRRKKASKEILKGIEQDIIDHSDLPIRKGHASKESLTYDQGPIVSRAHARLEAAQKRSKSIELLRTKSQMLQEEADDLIEKDDKVLRRLFSTSEGALYTNQKQRYEKNTSKTSTGAVFEWLHLQEDDTEEDIAVRIVEKLGRVLNDLPMVSYRSKKEPSKTKMGSDEEYATKKSVTPVESRPKAPGAKSGVRSINEDEVARKVFVKLEKMIQDSRSRPTNLDENKSFQFELDVKSSQSTPTFQRPNAAKKVAGTDDPDTQSRQDDFPAQSRQNRRQSMAGADDAHNRQQRRQSMVNDTASQHRRDPTRASVAIDPQNRRGSTASAPDGRRRSARPSSAYLEGDVFSRLYSTGAAERAVKQQELSAKKTVEAARIAAMRQEYERIQELNRLERRATSERDKELIRNAREALIKRAMEFAEHIRQDRQRHLANKLTREQILKLEREGAAKAKSEHDKQHQALLLSLSGKDDRSKRESYDKQGNRKRGGTYDKQGNLIRGMKITNVVTYDKNGNEQKNGAFDKNRNPLLWGPNGEVLFTEQGSLVTTKNEMDDDIYFDQDGNPISADDVMGVTYDAHGNPLRGGGYDSRGNINIGKVIDKTSLYDIKGRPDKNGTFDKRGRHVVFGPNKMHVFDIYGDLITIDNGGDEITYYDKEGNPIEDITFILEALKALRASDRMKPKLVDEDITYDKKGKPSPDGAYDRHGNPLIWGPGGEVLYDIRGNVITIKTGPVDGNMYYTKTGQAVDPDTVVGVTYDRQGNPVRGGGYAKSGSLMRGRSFVGGVITYDKNGKITKGGKYDKDGNLLVLGSQKEFLFDIFGNLVSNKTVIKEGDLLYDISGTPIEGEAVRKAMLGASETYDKNGKQSPDGAYDKNKNPIIWGPEGEVLYDIKGNIITTKTGKVEGNMYYTKSGQQVDPNIVIGVTYDKQGNPTKGGGYTKNGTLMRGKPINEVITYDKHGHVSRGGKFDKNGAPLIFGNDREILFDMYGNLITTKTEIKEGLVLYDQEGTPILAADVLGLSNERELKDIKPSQKGLVIKQEITYNKAGKPAVDGAFNRKGQPLVFGSKGEVLYDGKGNQISSKTFQADQIYFDKDGNQITSEGITGVTYDAHGNPTRGGNYDIEGEIIKGKVITEEEVLFDKDGHPDKRGNFDKYKRQVFRLPEGKVLYDLYGNPCTTHSVESGIGLYYDKYGNPVDLSKVTKQQSRAEPMHFELGRAKPSQSQPLRGSQFYDMTDMKDSRLTARDSNWTQSSSVLRGSTYKLDARRRSEFYVPTDLTSNHIVARESATTSASTSFKRDRLDKTEGKSQFYDKYADDKDEPEDQNTNKRNKGERRESTYYQHTSLHNSPFVSFPLVPQRDIKYTQSQDEISTQETFRRVNMKDLDKFGIYDSVSRKSNFMGILTHPKVVKSKKKSVVMVRKSISQNYVQLAKYTNGETSSSEEDFDLTSRTISLGTDTSLEVLKDDYKIIFLRDM